MESSSIMLYLGAIALGALHAFEPGHGKSIIAAYMIGTRGRAIDGIILGFIVTFTHTFSVIILGIIATLLAHSFSDQQLHAWMGLASALLILGVGLWLLKERLTGHDGHTHFHFFCKKGHDHGHGEHTHDHQSHDHGHDHDHHEHHEHDHAPPGLHTNDHDHPHPHDHTHQEAHSHAEHSHDHGHDHPHDHNHAHGNHLPKAAAESEGNSRWRLLMLGISGGMVPCPPAIAALLAAIGAGRISEGLTVTIFFSLGLGLVMMTIGVVLSQAGRLTEKIKDNMELGRKLGIISAAIITILGVYTLIHSLKDIL